MQSFSYRGAPRRHKDIFKAKQNKTMDKRKQHQVQVKNKTELSQEQDQSVHQHRHYEDDKEIPLLLFPLNRLKLRTYQFSTTGIIEWYECVCVCESESVQQGNYMSSTNEYKTKTISKGQTHTKTNTLELNYTHTHTIIHSLTAYTDDGERDTTMLD